MNWFDLTSGSSWAVAGLILVTAELMVPGVFLIWLGIAALATGGIIAAVGLSWQGAALVFAVAAIFSTLAGWALTRRRADEPGNARGLNRRGHELIGKVFRLEATMSDGEGRLRVGDSSWRIIGPELLAGSQVRVVRVDGIALVVEKA